VDPERPLPPAPAFRPDIEGLRGIAILLVVLFHAGVSGLSGGFVGVDVFFVLSGFFITAMLARELSETGDVDVNAFYTRRAMRLLPALLVTLLVTLGAVFWLYAPIDRAAIAADARAVALHGGNIAFASGAVDYFSTGDNPLLHTWSLAVEEQFYLVWPLLFLSLGFLGFGGQSERARNKLFVAIVVAGVLSFVASLWMTKVAQPWAFFGMPTRIWEFALGGALALVLARRTDTRTSASTVLQGAGLLMIVVAAMNYERATPYPGLAAVLPALGTSLLITGGDRAPESAVSRALSIPPLRWLGRVSYAWYLWHWPLVGAAAVLYPGLGVSGRLLWSGVALVLAWLTYRFIEQPVRNGTVLSRVPGYWLLPGTIAASVGVAALAHTAMVAAERGVASSVHRTFAQARVDRKQHNCWSNTVEDAKGPCEFGDTQSSTTLALFGDSHAEHWLGALDRYGKDAGVKIVVMVKGGCPVADMPELMQPRLKRFYHECTRYREAMVQRIIAMKPTAAILSSYDHYMPRNGKASAWQVTPAMWERGLRRTYERLSNAGVPVLAIRGTPRTWFDVPACLSRRAAGLPFSRNCSYSLERSLIPLAVQAQTRAARGLGVAFVDMNDQICSSYRCPTAKGGVVMFTDDNHLTATFSASLADVFGARLKGAMQELKRAGADAAAR
jgi:peptidoglycan/LPS O-acetylase OafA/YrhL